VPHPVTPDPEATYPGSRSPSDPERTGILGEALGDGKPAIAGTDWLLWVLPA